MKSYSESKSKHLWQSTPWSYLLALSAVALMTWIIAACHADASIANIPMLYLLVVTTSALFLGSLPAVFASIVAFLCFDYWFVDPRYKFTVHEPAEWLALCTFLLTATVTGQLTALLSARAEEAQRRKLETTALAEASWAVASELDRDRALNKVLSELFELIKPEESVLLVPDEQGQHKVIAHYGAWSSNEKIPHGIAHDAVAFVFETGRAIGWDSSQLWQKALASSEQPLAAYLPITVEEELLGVLYLKLNEEKQISSAETQLIDSLRNHAAVILQRDRLIQSQAKAEALAEADKLKTALLSMVSHDFRSPLTSIKASVSSLLEEGSPIDPEVQKGLLQGVIQETDRLNSMVGNILSLSRLEAGAWRPESETTAIAELVGSALDSFSRYDNERIQVELDRSIVDISVDSVQMVQVLKNLLENALKYSSVETAVELKTRAEAGNLIFEILDRGQGLPKGDEKQIFEPFYRAPALKESSVPGVGIGLALCRGLVEANGGTLTALNRSGGGSIFRVTLPQKSIAKHEAAESTEK